MPSSSTNAGVVQQLEAWLDTPESPRPDLYLFGPTGTGKTTIACTLANEFAHRQISTFFVGVRAFMQAHLDAVGDLADRKRAAQELDRRVREVIVLVFDDIAGGEKNSDFSRATLTSVLDDRLAAGRTTIWTSNLDLQQLAHFYGDERLPSRIAGACQGHIFVFRGEDHRLRRKQMTASSRK